MSIKKNFANNYCVNMRKTYIMSGYERNFLVFINFMSLQVVCLWFTLGVKDMFDVGFKLEAFKEACILTCGCLYIWGLVLWLYGRSFWFPWTYLKLAALPFQSPSLCPSVRPHKKEATSKSIISTWKFRKTITLISPQ